MAKKPTDDELLSIQLKDKDQDVLSADGTEPEFDDISPRFQRQVDRAAAEDAAEDDADEIDALDQDDDEDEPGRRKVAGEDDDDLEEEEAALEAEEEEDEDEPGRRKSAVTKRVARERRLLEEARSESRELRARQDELEARLAAQADETKFNTFKTEAEGKIADLRAQRRKAIEEGDTEKQDDLDDKIGDLKADLKSREREVEAAKAQLKESTAKRDNSPIVATKVQQWIRKHQRYKTDAGFKAAVNGIDNAVAAEGYDRESDEYYEEIDNRLKKLYPEEYPKPRVRRNAPSVQRRPGMGPTHRQDPNAPKFRIEGGKVRMSKPELKRIQANMQKFGLDPTSSEDVKAYVLNNRS